MIENISFELKPGGATEISLQYASGEYTILRYASELPFHMKDQYVCAIEELQKRQPDLSPSDDLFSLFTWWFAKCQLNIPISVSTSTCNDRQRIGNRIKEIREEKNLGAKQLAMLSGIDAANICKIEQGKYSVGLDVLSKIANALGYKIDLVKK